MSSATVAGGRRLGTLLTAMVLLATLLTFGLVGAGVILMRLPAQQDEHRALVEREAAAFSERQQAFLMSIERRLELLAAALAVAPPAAAPELLDIAVGTGQTLHAIYLLDPGGKVLTAGLPTGQRVRRDDIVGNDLSGLPLLRDLARPGRSAWGDKFISPLSGEATVGVLMPVSAERLMLAEVPLPVLLRMVRSSGSAAPVWLVDSRGEILVDSAGGAAVGRLNLRGSSLLQPSRPDQVNVLAYRFADGPHHVAVTQAAALNWTFIARVPAGLHHPRVTTTLLIVLGGLAAALGIGLALAPLLARRLSRAVQQLVGHAQRLADASEPVAWPRGPVREFNELADALNKTTDTLRLRELELSVVFDTAPVPLAVRRLNAEGTLAAANEAWCRLFGYRREDVVGRPADALDLWADEAARQLAYEQARAGLVDCEARLRRADGSSVLCRVSGRRFALGELEYMLWANEDITETRRIEQELRELNLELEDRVAARTQALAQANEELTGTLQRLQATRDELLRAEKLAALGRLVAGIAHELNTPLGNSLMAVSTLRDEVRQFRQDMALGLRRSLLDGLLASSEQATAIAGRNLQRAGELVAGFKQVAADQTSDQRRPFALAEVVHEIVLTLKPSFGRAACRIHTEVDPALRLDSYPGALGQALTNLISNAVVHAFEGRAPGTVTVRGLADGEAHVRLDVLDDGRGIAPELIDRIFEPFVTTRMGRGGTGLGLNIAHNVATQILGGSLSVRSTPDAGACFTLRLPRVAPAAPAPPAPPAPPAAAAAAVATVAAPAARPENPGP